MSHRDLQFIRDGVSRFDQRDPRTVVQDLLRLAVEAAGSKAGSVYLVDRKQNVLRPFTIIGLPDDYIATCGPVPVGEQCCGRAVAFRMPWIVSDMLADPDWVDLRGEIPKTGIRAAFSVPIIQGDDCIGSLACHYSEPFTPNPYAITRNQVFATLMAFALTRPTNFFEAASGQ